MPSPSQTDRLSPQSAHFPIYNSTVLLRTRRRACECEVRRGSNASLRVSNRLCCRCAIGFTLVRVTRLTRKESLAADAEEGRQRHHTTNAEPTNADAAKAPRGTQHATGLCHVHQPPLRFEHAQCLALHARAGERLHVSGAWAALRGHRALEADRAEHVRRGVLLARGPHDPLAHTRLQRPQAR